MDNRLYYLSFSQIRGIGPARLKMLVAYFGNLKKAWEAEPAEWEKALGGYVKVSEEFSETREKLDVKEYENRLLSMGIEYVTIDDVHYPSLLKQIHDPPFVLFYKGLLKKHALNIAIVGSRVCSNYGKEVTKYLSSKLAEKGINVVSGMARGIDSHAHLGALATGGYTTAVLGSGLDVIYPPENKGMFNRIIQNGLVISEFPPGMPPEAANFPARNRVISGLSQGVIVVEAAIKSGSLITADFALEQGRDVFAVPGHITSKNSKGTNNLIKQGAKIVADIDSVLEEYTDSWSMDNESSLYNDKITLSDKEELILNSVEDTPVDIDILSVKTGLKPDELNSYLTLLEVKGLINQVCGKKIIRSSF